MACAKEMVGFKYVNIRRDGKFNIWMICVVRRWGGELRNRYHIYKSTAAFCTASYQSQSLQSAVVSRSSSSVVVCIVLCLVWFGPLRRVEAPVFRPIFRASENEEVKIVIRGTFSEQCEKQSVFENGVY